MCGGKFKNVRAMAFSFKRTRKQNNVIDSLRIAIFTTCLLLCVCVCGGGGGGGGVSLKVTLKMYVQRLSPLRGPGTK